MQQTDVAQAIATLQAQGKVASHGNIRRLLGYGSLRDIVRYRNELLPGLDTPSAETEPSELPPAEKPLCLCYLCGYSQWREHTPGIWVCGLCNVPPPVFHTG
jgi:hypothetical protein